MFYGDRLAIPASTAAVTSIQPNSLATSSPPAEGVYNTSGGGGSGLTVRVRHEELFGALSATTVTTGWRQRWLHQGVQGLPLPTSAGQTTGTVLTLYSNRGNNIIVPIELYSVAVNDPVYSADMITAGYGNYAYGWISELQVNETTRVDGFNGDVNDGEEFFIDIFFLIYMYEALDFHQRKTSFIFLFTLLVFVNLKLNLSLNLTIPTHSCTTHTRSFYIFLKKS
jgi:hypothetical protein